MDIDDCNFYDVFFKRIETLAFTVKANSAEEAKIVAENLLAKGCQSELNYDKVMSHHNTIKSDAKFLPQARFQFED